MPCSGCPRAVATGAAPDLAALVGALYPSRRWGEPDDAARIGRGVSAATVRALARRAAEELRTVATAPATAEQGWGCDLVYVLDLGREPTLLALRDQSAVAPEHDRVTEHHLRVALSPLAPLATIQEVAIDLVRHGDDAILEERPLAGVRDELARARGGRLPGLRAIVASLGLELVDFRRLAAPPPPGFDPGAYPARTGELPTLANYLFFSEPATSVATSVLPCAQLRSPSSRSPS